MLSIIHRQAGIPSFVLEAGDIHDPGAPGPGQVRIRVAYVAIHPGDLQIIEGTPSAGGPRPIHGAGRTPGLEGVGVITAVGPGVEPAWGLRPGQAVAYFPVADGWSEYVIAPASAVALVPESVKLEVAAQALINTITAETVIRAGHAAWPEDQRHAVTVLQSGAASAVGKIISALLDERNVALIRLVRSGLSARRLAGDAIAGPVIATEETGWENALHLATAGKNLYVAVDSVGGHVLPALADVLQPGGTIVSYGSQGGAGTDIRLAVPRELTIKGVSIWSWAGLPVALRQSDVQTALRLMRTRPDLFPVEAIYTPAQIKPAVEHVRRPGRSGAILLKFEGAIS